MMKCVFVSKHPHHGVPAGLPLEHCDDDDGDGGDDEHNDCVGLNLKKLFMQKTPFQPF